MCGRPSLSVYIISDLNINTYAHGYMSDTNQLGVNDQQVLEILGFENKVIPHNMCIDKHNHGSI